jgi:hypothetical protein
MMGVPFGCGREAHLMLLASHCASPTLDFQPNRYTL